MKIYKDKDKIRKARGRFSSVNYFVDKIDFENGKISILDPNTSTTQENGIIDKQIMKGVYEAYIDIWQEYQYYEIENKEEATKYNKHIGDLVILPTDASILTLKLVHENFANKEILNSEDWIDLCEIKVSSGICGFYNARPKISNTEEWNKFKNNLKTLGKTGRFCDINASGITLSSGFKTYDNTAQEYTLMYLDFDDEIMALQMVFIERDPVFKTSFAPPKKEDKS